MADRIQQRRDTKARWEEFNPVLLEGEAGYVLDDPNLYKIGNGEDAWNSLPYRGFDGTITQETGDSENAVMSQKAVTEKLSELGSKQNNYAFADFGINLVNPNMLSNSAYLGEGGKILTASLEGWKVTGFIPVNARNISTSSRAAVEGYPLISVYDGKGCWIRDITDSTLYEYQDGEHYIRFCAYGSSISAFRCNYGDTLSPYEEFTTSKTLDVFVNEFSKRTSLDISDNFTGNVNVVKSIVPIVIQKNEVVRFSISSFEANYTEETGGGLSLYLKSSNGDYISANTAQGYSVKDIYDIKVTEDMEIIAYGVSVSKISTYNIQFKISYGTDVDLDYAKKELRENIYSTSGEKLDKTYGTNIVNPKNIQKGKYIGRNGVIMDSAFEAYAVSGLVEVKGNDIATNAYPAEPDGTYPYYVVYDKDEKILRLNTESPIYLYQDGDMYIQFGTSTLRAECNNKEPYANFGNVLKEYEDYIEFKEIADYIKSNYIAKESFSVKSIIVDKNGTGDYTSVVSAIQSIHDSSAANVYNIYINEGEYDIVEEFFGDDEKYTTEGVVLPDYVNLIGVGKRNNVVLKAEFDSSEITNELSKAFATLNLKYNNDIKNITFIAKNCRYPLHDESRSTFKNYVRNVHNCKFWHKGRDHESMWEWCSGYGVGFSEGSQSQFVRCDFITEEAGGGAFGGHDNVKWNNPATISFESCSFTNNGGRNSFRLGSLGSGVQNMLSIVACKFKGVGGNAMRLYEESGYAGAGCDYIAYGHSNVDMEPEIIVTDGNEYETYFV